MRLKRAGTRMVLGVMIVAVLAAVAVLATDAHVRNSARPNVISLEDAAAQGDFDCVLVLGCGVNPDGNPSDMLADRIEEGIALYNAGAAPKILMSGDHSQTGYDEVNTMKLRAKAAGVPSQDIFMDHAGFSTYESMRRAKDVFRAQKVLIVSQEYHLYRALYLADALGLDACGVSADLRPYAGQTLRDLREVLARAKDAVTAITLPDPTFLGDEIPIWGDGNQTND